jgi:hypothetical protein
MQTAERQRNHIHRKSKNAFSAENGNHARGFDPKYVKCRERCK